MSRHGFSDHLNGDQVKNIVKEVIKNSKSGEFFISSSNFYLVLKHLIKNQDFNPYSSESYLNHLMEINSDLVDDVAKTFILESLRSFKLNCYFGSMVLLGMCAETIFMHFANEMRNFIKIDMSHTITTTFKNLLKSLEPLKNKLPSNIGQNLELWLSEFFNYIRQTRNELHLPIVNRFSREAVYGIFLRFPVHLDNLICVLNYFKDKKLQMPIST